MSMDLWFDQRQQDGPDGDCEHDVPGHIACEYCEIARLEKLLAEEEADSAEMQALLFAMMEGSRLALFTSLAPDVYDRFSAWYRRFHPPTAEE